MGARFLAIVLVGVMRSCWPFEPSDKILIHVSEAKITAPHRFTSSVVFENKLGREVHIMNLGCSQDGHFIPNFTLQRVDAGHWKDYAGPLCVALAVSPTSLSDGKSFTTSVGMMVDTIATGLYRIQFDIRDASNASTIPADQLISNMFSIQQ